MVINIDNIIEKVKSVLASHRIEEGIYSRWIWQNDNKSRELGINEYGCADAANILYTIGSFPSEPELREKWVKTLQNMQNPDTGLFTENTHHYIHTTAHCAAALELFDAKTEYGLTKLAEYSEPEKLIQFLENLDYVNNPWNESHKGAGLFSAMILCGAVNDEWKNAYFNWFWENADPESGMWRKGAVEKSAVPMSHHMAGTFHYLFNHEYCRMPLRYPDKLIDSCLMIYEKELQNTGFGRQFGFMEIDWVYCITRSMRQTPHRFDECRDILIKFAKGYTDYLSDADEKTDDGFNDMHALFGSMCCLAELQQSLRGVLKSQKPLKLVLDRRPFI